MDMNRLLQLAAAAFLAIGAAQAATVYVSPIPAGIQPGDSFEIYVGILLDKNAAPPEEVTDFSFDVVYSPALSAGTPEELGYFRDNGVFFFFNQGVNEINFISDVLSGGDSMKIDDMVFKIPFTYGEPSQEPLFVTINGDTSYVDGPEGQLAFSVSSTTEPVPEPGTFVLAGAALVALRIRQLRRGR
jgi:hypothetical protein